jgi:peptide/nickel transport system substrate-binding protein
MTARTALASLGLLALLLCGAACDGSPRSAAGDAAAQIGGTLVIGNISDVDNWNEYLTGSAFAHTLQRRIFLRLADPRPGDGDAPPGFEPSLAESWDFSEDGLVLSFRLREALWSDGRPLTAGDVAFTWTAQTSDAVAWGGRRAKARIVAVEAVDPRTVRFRFDGRYPDRLADAVAGGILPRHVFGAVPFAEWARHDWSTIRVGSGPFLLKEHLPQQQITLVRNPRYLEPGRPALDRVVIRIVPDASALLTQLLSGDVDYLEGVAPREARRVAADPGASIVAFPRAGFDFIGWNASHEPFDDPAVRRALTLSIDRQALVTDLMLGYGRVSSGPVPSFWWQANRAITPWPCDEREALRLLRSRGYRPRDGDGLLVRNDEPLQFELLTNAGNRLREAMQVKIQEQLRGVGVRVELRTLELGALIARLTQGDFDAVLLGTTFTGKLELEGNLHSDGVRNVVGYRSAEVDRLLAVAAAAEDTAAMKQALDEVQSLVHRDQPYTFLYEEQRLVAFRNRVQGIEIPLPSDPLARLEHYRVRR